MSIPAIIQQLMTDWAQPRVAQHEGRPTPVALVCSFESPASTEAIEAARELHCSQSILDFWASSDGAFLFSDPVYGQWGLKLLSVCDAINETKRFELDRPEDFESGDIVIGTFLGDSDFLVLRCQPSSVDDGKVLVALPLDPRSDWDHLPHSFEQFLSHYSALEGEKFWRRRSSTQ